MNRITDALALTPVSEQQMSIDVWLKQEKHPDLLDSDSWRRPDMELELFTVSLVCESLAAQPISFCKNNLS